MRAISASLLALVPALGCAEVMDKEFSLGAVLLWGLIGGALMFFAARLKPLLLLVVAPAIGLFFFGHLSELTDLYVGPAVKIEAGQFYIFIAWVMPVLALVGGGLGYVLRRHNLKTNTSE